MPTEPLITPAPPRRTQVRRKAERGRYDRNTIEGILDEGLVAHVGVVTGDGCVVIPMVYGRSGDSLYLHGATGNSTLRAALAERDISVTVTLLDGLVLSRSSYHHSVNYRSVVIFGRAAEVTDPAEKRNALLAVVEHLVPGRADDCRPPSESELRATSVVRLPIDEASAKVREGGPVEDPDDLVLPYWAGVLPLAVTPGRPVADGFVPSDVALPPYVRTYARG